METIPPESMVSFPENWIEQPGPEQPSSPEDVKSP